MPRVASRRDHLLVQKFASFIHLPPGSEHYGFHDSRWMTTCTGDFGCVGPLPQNVVATCESVEVGEGIRGESLSNLRVDIRPDLPPEILLFWSHVTQPSPDATVEVLHESPSLARIQRHFWDVDAEGSP
jgi:hypothetical protein